MAIAKTVGDRIRLAREALELNQAQFARELGIKPPSVNDLESGKTKKPAADTLLRMRHLGINPEFIVNGRGLMFLKRVENHLQEDTLLSMFRELSEDNRKHAMDVLKTLRRTQGGSSKNDPFGIDPPSEGGS